VARIASETDPASLTLCEMAEAIGRRHTTSRAIVTACLERIEAHDRDVGAFVALDRDGALAAADRADAAVARGDRLEPLHGVPLAHKDMFARSARPPSFGSAVRHRMTTGPDATVLERLDRAGAINLGALAMVEFAMGPHGYNAHLRPCRNPWHLDHVPCGSSSGSGVALASRFVAGSLGSDTGGSIRCPAAANGVVGLLPTYSRVSRHGVMPMSFSLDCVGPLARTAADCARLLTAIAGHDPRDPTSSRRAMPDCEAGLGQSISGVRVGIPDRYFTQGIAPEVQTHLAQSLDCLKACGARLVEVTVPPSVDDVADLHPLVMKAEGAANHHLWMRTLPEKYTDEVRHRLQAGYFIPASDYLQALKLRAALLRDWTTLFDRVEVLHTALLPQAAPTIKATSTNSGPDYLAMVVSLTRNTKICNFLGLPAISVPCGFTGKGLPVSFQLIGRPFAEGLLLRLAHRYQCETDWHHQTPSFASGQNAVPER
jgi:aspartyl-tRNA(Asn)/glutamyl-tRNA(Gln) amidotransferase subunit A